MARVQTDQTAEDHIDQIEARWGSVFSREYMAKLALLAGCPLAGHPYVHPDYHDINRILLKRCRHYIYYRYDPAADIVTILAVWSSSRGMGPFDR